jgi:hypothetical protein
MDENLKEIQEQVLNEDADRHVEIFSKFAGVEIERIGYWLYLRGKTYQNKEAIRAEGAFWSKKHKCWIYAPAIFPKKRRATKWSIKQIRDEYGSELIKTQSVVMAAAAV